MKTKRTVYLLIVTNLFTLLALFVILFHYQVPIKILNRLGMSYQTSAVSDYRYTKDLNYEVRRSLFKVYKPQRIKIVMLGNSITYGADWNELLTRTDVANRGIGGDVTEGFINRLSDIYTLNPEICFIMGGINDIVKGIPVNDIYSNFIKIIEGLQSKKITPIIQSTLYVSNKLYDWKEINTKVDELNNLLTEYAEAKDVTVIDINKELTTNGALNAAYTYDGLHLLGNGYEKWRNLILPKL